MYLLRTMVIPLVASTVAAVPIQQHSGVVYNPRITSPKASYQWKQGSMQNVTWDAAQLPAQSKDATGTVLLGYWEGDSENLDTEHPLAKDFSLKKGYVSLRVPKAPPRDDYFIVLFGDSGNISPTFKIVKA